MISKEIWFLFYTLIILVSAAFCGHDDIKPNLAHYQNKGGPPLKAKFEVKFRIQSNLLPETLNLFDLQSDDNESEQIQVLLFEDRSIRSKKNIIRLRKSSDSFDTTCKIKGLSANDALVDAFLKKHSKEFKCENNITSSEMASACSFKVKFKDEKYLQPRSLSEIFTRDQILYYKKATGIDLVKTPAHWSQTINSKIWEFEYEDIEKIEIEFWKMPSGTTYLELSFKGSGDYKGKMKNIEKVLADNNINLIVAGDSRLDELYNQ